MKNIKYIIIMLIMILIIVISWIMVLINKNDEIDYDDTIEQDILVELQAGISKEENDYRFFGIEDFINQFFQYIETKNEDAIYELLDDGYKKQYNVESIIKDINNKGNINSFYLNELYKREGTNNWIYYVSGILELTNSQGESDFQKMYFQLYVDSNNAADIKILEEDEYNKEIADTSENINEKKITKNKYNNYNILKLTSWELAERYISDFSFRLRYDVEEAFDLLDEECKEGLFNNDIKKFDEYIQENKNTLYNIKIHDCKSKVTEDYIEYSIKDSSSTEYTIKRKSAMKYSISLKDNI